MLIDEYITTKNTDNARRAYKSIINSYLNWRKISLDELIKNDLEEENHFEKYLADSSVNVILATRKIHISVVKGFLIYCGVKFKRYSRKKKPYYYEDDPVMQDFLILTGSAEITKRGANRHLYMYCEFRKKTPTELIEELATITKPKLRVHLKQFYDNMTVQTKRNILSRIIRFYRIMADYHIDLPNLRSPKKTKLLMNQKQLVDKEIVKELLKVSDLRDSMIVLTCFESGLNPVDLVVFNYGDLKPFLNLEEPKEINDVAVIPRIRSKTNYEFLACFGSQSLQYMSAWLKVVKKNLKNWKQELTDDFPIFCQKHAPHQRLNNYSISNILKLVSDQAGLEPLLTNDFRKGFNTRTKPYLKHYDKALFMGHAGGIERHYDVSSLEYYTDEYRKAWKILFDLTFDDIKLGKLEDKMTEQELLIQDLTKTIEKQNQALQLFYQVFHEQIEKKGLDETLDELIPIDE